MTTETTLAPAPVKESLGYGYELESGQFVQAGTTYYYASATTAQIRQYPRRHINGGIRRYTTDPAKHALIVESVRAQVLSKVHARKAKADAKRAATAAWVNPLQVGEVLHSSWGYDQTNVEHFQVLEVRPRAIKVQELEQEVKETGFMAGIAKALPNKFKAGSSPTWITIQLRIYDGKTSFYIPSPIHGYLYQGGLEHSVSWYA